MLTETITDDVFCGVCRAAERDARIAELERKLDPRCWSKAEAEAWHRALPDVQKAFEALLAADSSTKELTQ